MSKKDEALKLALGKVKSARNYHPNAVDTLLFEAEEVLEEALNAPLAEQKSGIKQVIELYDSPEQPAQQEPFGYIKPGEGDYEKVFSWNYNERNGYTQSVYTSPPAQRKPLTDEEIKRMAAPLFMSHYWNLCNEFARAIEAAHNIKENT